MISLLLRLLDRDFVRDKAKLWDVNPVHVLIEGEIFNHSGPIEHSLEALLIALLEAHEHPVKLFLVVMDLTLLIVEESGVRVSLGRVVHIAVVIEEIPSALFHVIKLGLSVHAHVTRQVPCGLRLHLVDSGRIAALSAVVDDTLLDHGPVDAGHVQQEAEELHQDGVRVEAQVLISNVVGGNGRLQLLDHPRAVEVDGPRDLLDEAVPPLRVDLVEGHLGLQTVAHQVHEQGERG